MSKMVRSKVRVTQVEMRAPRGEHERMTLLKRKLLEEAGELLTAETREEMRMECVDVYEVVRSIAAALGMTPESFEHQRIQKAAMKGDLITGNVIEVS